MLTLKNVLMANALSSGATGLLLLVFPSLFARWFGIDSSALFAGVGIFLITFGIFVFTVARKPTIEPARVKFIIGLDIAWVIASVMVMAADYTLISAVGLLMIAAVGGWVAMMALLQIRGLKAVATLAFLVLSFANHAQPKSTATALTNKNEPVDVVNAFIDAVKNDHKKIPSLLDSLIQWHQPGNNPLSGTRNNLKQVYQLFGGFNQLSAGTLTLTESKILGVHGNQVACLMHWKAAQPVGRVLDVDNVDVYTVENGKIVNVFVFTADPEQEDRFWMK